MKTEYSFIIDFSFDGEKLTIFELGDFFTSSLERLDQLRSKEGKEPLKEEYMAQLRKANPDAIYIETDEGFCHSISFEDFSSNHREKYRPLYRERTIQALLTSIGILGQQKKLTRPVIASLHSVPSVSTRTTLATLTNDKFKLLNYPQGVLREAARDKTVLHAFTNKSSLCPPTVLLDLRSDDTLANVTAFLEENKTTHYVIKPTSLTQSTGVEIITQENVKKFVKKLQRGICSSSIDVGLWSASFAQLN